MASAFDEYDSILLRVVKLIKTDSWHCLVAPDTGHLFVNGGSQTVRLPAEIRFDGLDEIYIRRDAVTGDVILSASRISTAWSDFFTLRDVAEVRIDFINDRPLNKPLKARKVFEDR